MHINADHGGLEKLGPFAAGAWTFSPWKIDNSDLNNFDGVKLLFYMNPPCVVNKTGTKHKKPGRNQGFGVDTKNGEEYLRGF